MSHDSKQDSLKVAVIIGSNREGRFGGAITEWLVEQIDQRDDFAVDIVDVAELSLPSSLTKAHDANVQSFRQRLDDADAFIVVTPEYNHSYPGPLKHAIDFAGIEWRRKPVAFVSYGGNSGALRAVEHLRTVFSEFHATTIRDVVSFHNYWTQFDKAGALSPTSQAPRAAQVMLDELFWWGDTLRRARRADDAAAA